MVKSLSIRPFIILSMVMAHVAWLFWTWFSYGAQFYTIQYKPLIHYINNCNNRNFQIKIRSTFICPNSYSKFCWSWYYMLSVLVSSLFVMAVGSGRAIPDSKVHGANMGPIWGWQDPDGPHVGPMNFGIWDVTRAYYVCYDIIFLLVHTDLLFKIFTMFMLQRYWNYQGLYGKKSYILMILWWSNEFCLTCKWLSTHIWCRVNLIILGESPISGSIFNIHSCLLPYYWISSGYKR